MEHFDLLQVIWHRRHVFVGTVVHIRAHQEPHLEYDLLKRYFILGNQTADLTAHQTCAQHLPELREQLHELRGTVEREQRLLHGMLQLNLELQGVYKRAHEQQISEPAGPQAMDTITQAFSSWSPTDAFGFAPQLTLEWAHGSLYGRQVTSITLRWLAEFEWTIGTDGPMGYTTGVSWIELALSWCLWGRRYLPIQRPTADEALQVIVPGNDASLLGFGVSYWELGKMLPRLVDHLATVIPEPFYPPLIRKTVSSMQFLGSKMKTQGLAVRPGFPCQDLVVSHLVGQLQDSGHTALGTTPQLGLDSEDLFLEGTVGSRRNFAASCQARVRGLR
eukprot:Skav210369  [mRNA]  locus=scaffold1357:442676:443674:+ [translate_table: standard]